MKKKQWLCVTLAAMMSLICGCAGAERSLAQQETSLTAAPETDTSADDQFARFLLYWPGTCDNNRQVERRHAENMPLDDRNDHLRLFVRRIENSAFGPDAYYVEWQSYVERKLVRQRIYSFYKEGGRFVLKLHVFPTDIALRERTGGAHLEPSKLDDLTPEDMFKLEGCEIFF